MLKLIKLEWKKNNIKKYIVKALIMTTFLCLFLFALAFLILTCVMLASFIVSAYKIRQWI